MRRRRVECQPFRPLFGTRLVHLKRAKLSAKVDLFGRVRVRKTVNICGFRVNFGPRRFSWVIKINKFVMREKTNLKFDGQGNVTRRFDYRIAEDLIK